MSSRRPMVAGNWKMNVSPGEATPLVRAMRSRLSRIRDVDLVVCPPFPALTIVRDLLCATDIEVGAQNCHWEGSGAFTGEVAAPMLSGVCRYVIIGHSERRAMFGDTDQTVRSKVAAALKAGLTPILCVGEDLAQNEQGRTAEVVATQTAAALDNLAPAADQLVVAYEPVWAIGTGRACAPAAANRVCGLVVRGVMAEALGPDTAARVRVLYGGSVKPENAGTYFCQPDIDGALVGGASLKPEPFAAIARAAQAG